MSPKIVLRQTVAPRHAGRPPAVVAPRGRTSSPAVIGREIRASMSGMLRDLMLNAADAVEANCPIQTGHLLSNFILATGSPHQGVEGSREAVSYAAQDAGREKVLAFDIGRDKKIYLTNDVDYLRYQRPFLTEAMTSAASSAPRGTRTRARTMLKAMAKSMLKRGA